MYPESCGACYWGREKMNTRTTKGWAARGIAVAILFWAAGCYGQGSQWDLEMPVTEAFLAPETDAALRHTLIEAVRRGGNGALSYLRNRKFIELTNTETLQAAQHNNLAIQFSEQDKEIAREVLQETKAAFNPILNLSGSYNRFESYSRKAIITRRTVTTTTVSDQDLNKTLTDLEGRSNQDGKTPPPARDENGTPIPDSNGSNNFGNFGNFGNVVCITVNGDVVNRKQCSLKTTTEPRLEFANVGSPALESFNFSFGISQRFPWGQNLSAQFRSDHQLKNFFTGLDSSGLDQQLSTSDPIRRGSSFPWTSAFTASFNSPLPFSKNFGPYGSVANVNVLLADRSDRSAAWSLEAQANTVLRSVDGAYWEVVRNVRLLQIVTEQRRVLEALTQRAQRLFEVRILTTYDKAQAEADLENVKNQEQIAWNSFIASSNALVELLNFEPGVIILPVGYSVDLLGAKDRPPIPIEPAEAFETAMDRRPEIKASQLAIESGEILLNQRKTQLRPDLNLIAGVTLSQSNAVLGYATWQDSFSYVFNPDRSDFFVGVSFRVPFGNLAAKSLLSQARTSRDQAMDQSQQVINGVTQEINTVIATAYSSHARIRQSKASLDYAQLAYNKADALQEQGLVTEFELLRKLSDLLTARSAYINTLIDYRKTRAQLLSAQGILAAQY